MTADADTIRDIALRAWRAQAHGHATGDFEPYYAFMADDIVITMPVGAFRGENHGLARAREIYSAIAAANPRLVYDQPLHVAVDAQTVLIEFHDHGTIAGMPYANRIVGSFDVRYGRIAAYREYFGDIDPAIMALMSGS